VLGAAFGGWIGDRFHGERSARREADERARVLPLPPCSPCPGRSRASAPRRARTPGPAR
jgi:hypothetical protein